jgi:outer membrane protein
MKKSLIALAVAAALVPSLAMAEAGDIVVRLRATNITANEGSDLGKYVNKNVGPNTMSAGAELKVDSNTIPEIDFSYYITKNIAAELILATGTKHDVSVIKDSLGTVGNQDLGSVNLLPPTLLLQWHFNPDQTFDPYVGAGVNYTAFLDRKLRFESGAAGVVAGQKIKLDHDSWGLAAQAGLDVNLKDGWLINADVKYIQIDTKVKGDLLGGYKLIDKLDIDPWVVSIGFGKKF